MQDVAMDGREWENALVWRKHDGTCTVQTSKRSTRYRLRSPTDMREQKYNLRRYIYIPSNRLRTTIVLLPAIPV